MNIGPGTDIILGNISSVRVRVTGPEVTRIEVAQASDRVLGMALYRIFELPWLADVGNQRGFHIIDRITVKCVCLDSRRLKHLCDPRAGVVPLRPTGRGYSLMTSCISMDEAAS